MAGLGMYAEVSTLDLNAWGWRAPSLPSVGERVACRSASRIAGPLGSRPAGEGIGSLPRGVCCCGVVWADGGQRARVRLCFGAGALVYPARAPFSGGASAFRVWSPPLL